MNVLNKKLDFFHFITVYTILLFPALLASGSLLVNIFQVVICFHGIYVLVEKKVDLRPIFMILIFLFIYSIIITIFYKNFYFLKNTFVFLKIILFILSFNFLFKYSFLTLAKVLKTFNIILLVFLFDTYFQFFFEKNILGFPIEPNNKVRLTSFFEGEYVIGGFLFRMFYPLVVFQLIYFKNDKKKFLFFLIIFILLNISIFLSGERAPLIFITVFFLLSIIFLKYLRKILISVSSLVLLLILVTLSINEKLKDRFIFQTFEKTLRLSSKSDFKDNFLNNHYSATFIAGYEIWKQNKFFGNGLRGYRIHSCGMHSNKLVKKIEKISNHGHFICNTHPHNFVIELLVDLGIIGLVFWLFFLFLIIKEINKMKSNNIKLEIFYGINFLVIFWPLLTHGSMFSSWNSSFFLFSIGIFFSNHKLFGDKRF